MQFTDQKVSFLDLVVQGDCMELLAQLPNNCVDVCFADPPFNLDKKYNSYRDSKQQKDYISWCRLWLSELVRVTRPTGSIYIHNIPKWLTHYAAILNEIAYFRHWIAWDAMSNPLGKSLLPAHYGILFYTKKRNGFKFYEIRSPHRKCRSCGAYSKDYGGKSDQRHPFGALVSDVWTDIHRIRHNKRRDLHPCQLPVHLLERIILMSSDPGDVVLDPFLGTGTTAIAAKALGRRFIGFELDARYVEIARRKIDMISESKYGQFYVSYFLGNLHSIRDIDAAQAFPPQLTTTEKRKQRIRKTSDANSLNSFIILK